MTCISVNFEKVVVTIRKIRMTSSRSISGLVSSAGTRSPAHTPPYRSSRLARSASLRSSRSRTNKRLSSFPRAAAERNIPTVTPIRLPRVIQRLPMRSARGAIRRDPPVMPARPELKRIPSSPARRDHSWARTGAANEIARTSKPSMPLRIVQIATTAT